MIEPEETSDPVPDLLVYFFIPLPEPIGLPGCAVMSFGSDEHLSDVLARTTPGDDLEPEVTSYSSLVVHKLEWTQPAHGVDDHLVAKVEKVLPWLTSRSNPIPASTDEPLPALTLIEIAVLVRELGAGLTDAFDQALRSIRFVQKAYSRSPRRRSLSCAAKASRSWCCTRLPKLTTKAN